jgi:hypothetical protein
VDKLKRNERDKSAQALAALGISAEQAVPFSAVTGEGRDDLLQSIEGLLSEEGT